MKKTRLLIATALLTAAMSTAVFAGEWKQDTVGWWYQNDDNSYAANVIKQINGLWYYFDNTGYMKTGDHLLSDGWYRFREDGSCTNPISQTTGYPVGGPAAGWIECTDRSEAIAKEILDGRVVFYNGLYWSSPDFVNNLKDIANRDIVTRTPTNTLQPGTKIDFSNGVSEGGDYDEDYEEDYDDDYDEDDNY